MKLFSYVALFLLVRLSFSQVVFPPEARKIPSLPSLPLMTNKNTTYRTFVDLTKQKRPPCEYFYSNDCYIDLNLLRQQNLKLDIDLKNLQQLFNSRQNCPPQNESLNQELERLKLLISNLTVKIQSELTRSGNQGNSYLQLMNLMVSLQTQQQSLIKMIQEMVSKTSPVSCSEIQSLLQSQISDLQRQLADAWGKHDKLMQKNQELESYIVSENEKIQNLQTFKNDLEQSQKLTAQLIKENAILKENIKDLSSGIRIEELFFKYAEAQKQNGRLLQQLEEFQKNQGNSSDGPYKEKFQQMQQIAQDLTRQLEIEKKKGETLSQRELQIKEQTIKISSLENDLQTKDKSLDALKINLQNCETKMNNSLNQKTIELNICKTSEKVLEEKIKEMFGNCPGTNMLNFENKSLRESNTQLQINLKVCEDNREKVSMEFAGFNQCKVSQREAEKELGNMKMTVASLQSQRDEFQLKISSTSSLQAQLQNCNNKNSQLMEQNANFKNFQRTFEELDTQISDRKLLLTEINTLRSANVMLESKCFINQAKSDASQKIASAELSSCRKMSTDYQESLKALAKSDSRNNQLITQVASLRKEIESTDSKYQQCLKSLYFQQNLENQLKICSNNAKESADLVFSLRTQLSISTNDNSKCRLEIAEVPELQRKLKVMEQESQQLQSLRDKVNVLANEIQVSKETLVTSDSKYQNIKKRFDQCFEIQNETINGFNECQQKLTLSEKFQLKLQKDLQVLEAGNISISTISQENRELMKNVETLKQNLSSLQDRCSQVNVIQLELNTCNSKRNSLEGSLSQCQQEQDQNKLKIAQLDGQSSLLVSLQSLNNQKDSLIANLTQENNSYANFQSQISKYESQLREKEEIEQKYSQTSKDLADQKSFYERELARLNEEAVRNNKELIDCDERRKALQAQISNTDSNCKSTLKLQEEVNTCQNSLRASQEKSNSLETQLSQSQETERKYDLCDSDFKQTKIVLKDSQDKNASFSTYIQSLEIQLSSVPTLMTKIDQQNNQINDLKKENDILLVIKKILEDIQDGQKSKDDQAQDLINQIESKEELIRKCQKDLEIERITTVTQNEERKTCEAKQLQLQEEISKLTKDSKNCPRDTLMQNNQLKAALELLNLQIKACNDQNSSCSSQLSQHQKTLQDIQSCRSQLEQLTQANQQLNEKVKEIPVLQRTVSTQTSEIESLKEELNRLKFLEELLKKLEYIFEENTKLNQEVQLRTLQLNEVREKLKKLEQSEVEQKAKYSTLDFEFNKCMKDKDDLKNQLEKLSPGQFLLAKCQEENAKERASYNILSNEHQKCLQQVSETNQIQADLKTCSSENQTCKNDLQQSKSELVSLNIEMSSMIQDKELISSLQKQIDDLNSLNQELNKRFIEQNSNPSCSLETELLKNKLQQCQQESSSMQQSLQKKIKDNERENLVNKTKLDDCNKFNDILNKQIQEISNNQSELGKLRAEMLSLRNQSVISESTNKDLLDRLNKCSQMMAPCEKLQTDLNAFSFANSELKNQIEKLSVEMSTCATQEQEIFSLNMQIKQLSEVRTQNEGLNNQVSTLNSENTKLVSEILTLNSRISDLSSDLKNYQESQKAQIEKLNGELSQSRNTVNDLNGKIFTITNDNKLLIGENQRLNILIQNKFSCQDLISQIQSLQERNSSLQLQVQSQDSSIQELTKQRNSLEIQFNDCKNKETNTITLKQQLQVLQIRLSEATANLSSCNNKLQSVQLENSTLSKNLQNSNADNASLKTQLNNSQIQVQSQQLTLSNNQMQNKTLNQQIELLTNKYQEATNGRKTIECNQQVDGLVKQISTLTKSNQSLLVQIEQVRILSQDCAEIKRQRDLYASILLSYQMRLTQFKDRVLVSSPASAQESNQILTTTTIRTKLDGGQTQSLSFDLSNSGANIEQQITLCQNQFAQCAAEGVKRIASNTETNGRAK